jgi:hypothetical protein
MAESLAYEIFAKVKGDDELKKFIVGNFGFVFED